MRTLTARCILTFTLLDVLFNPLVVAAFISLLGIEQKLSAALVLGLMVALKIGSNASFLTLTLRPYERYARAESRARTSKMLMAADETVQALPRRFGIFYSFSWSLCYGLGFLAITTLLPEVATSAGSGYAVSLVAVAVWFGGFAFAFPIATMITSSAAGECSVNARNEGVSLDRRPGSLQVRIGVIAFALGVGPTLWMIALGYMKQREAWDEMARQRAEVAAATLAQVVTQQPGAGWEQLAEKLSAAPGVRETDTVFLINPDISPAQGPERLEAAIGTAPFEYMRQAFIKTPALGSTILDGNSLAYVQLDDGRYAVAMVPSVKEALASFVLGSAIFALLVGVWAPVSAVALGRAVSSPLEGLTKAVKQIVELGRQSEMSSLPVARSDEVGVLSSQFNDLIDLMRELSKAADAIAAGELDIKIERSGELPDAFRRMTESLRQMVGQIRETAVDLASATTEIFAASQEQEAAAASQSSAMEEISRTMDSLSESAAHVSEAVQGVLSNAERTLNNTDEMVERITQLSTHASRIGEILEVIREIADRSDLLALNGSLEASRAGEGGHGFALVATEMRRLAERVTASVEDIKRLVTDIRDSSSSTVMATEESKRLAKGTTEAARQITFVTQQQRSGTEQVSQSVKNITEVVTQSVSATSQTRTSAEGLKIQADNLTNLLTRFEVAPAEAAE